MLKSLSVRNYALISSLRVDFEGGLSTITGETGAGKSILMGALSLILGSRADSGVLKDKTVKCIIEGQYEVSDGLLDELFESHDLDSESMVILRREIIPSGKSRAFINDTPVTLPVMKEFGDRLVNIHAQQENLMLNQDNFPILALDGYLKLDGKRESFGRTFQYYQQRKHEFEELKKEYDDKKRNQDFIEFQLNQLIEARLDEDKQQELEQERETLEHAEEIQTTLGQVSFTFEDAEQAILVELKQNLQALRGIEKFFGPIADPLKRFDEAYLELKDIQNEIRRLADSVEADPSRLQWVQDRLDLLYTLQQKHQLNSQEELIVLRDQLQEELNGLELSNNQIVVLEKELEQLLSELMKEGSILSDLRKAGVKEFCSSVESILIQLGMPNAKFRLNHSMNTQPGPDGLDEMALLFAANKNQEPEIVSKVASGGEVSRLMLSIKSLISNSLHVPTLIFDEIDAGVSGEIADKMGRLIKNISTGRQVLNITHLPQVARAGDHHYLVYKYDDEKTTHTAIKKLNREERVEQIARMLSGETVTEAAMSNARQLLD